MPEDHICFLIDNVIEGLELGPAARGNTVLGAPVYDPLMMLKVLFHGYIGGIRSSRKLAAECLENILFIHLCGGATPDFRTICRFRSENESLLQSAFSELIRRLVQAGVVSGSHLIVDGTKDGRYFRVYEAQRACDGCPGRQDCFGQSRNRFHKLERTHEHPWLHKYRERFLQSRYQERLRGRKLIEHNCGHLKHNLGFRRFLLRGLSGARIEAFLTVFASVLGRVCNILARTGRNWGCLMRMRMAAAPTAA